MEYCGDAGDAKGKARGTRETVSQGRFFSDPQGPNRNHQFKTDSREAKRKWEVPMLRKPPTSWLFPHFSLRARPHYCCTNEKRGVSIAPQELDCLGGKIRALNKRPICAKGPVSCPFSTECLRGLKRIVPCLTRRPHRRELKATTRRPHRCPYKSGWKMQR